MSAMSSFLLSFDGADATNHEIDLYDVAEALFGFQRSLAITTHLILNGKIITQAPALKGAFIRAKPPAAGSWEVMATVTLVAGAVYALGTTSKDSPIGHLVYSAYDYIIKSLLGVNVDYDKTLGTLIKERKRLDPEMPEIGQGHFDAAAEKCEKAVAQMHRPIVQNETATRASVINLSNESRVLVGTTLNKETFEHVAFSVRSDSPKIFRGRIAGYYSGSYRGRIYIPDLGRTVPFELQGGARGQNSLQQVTRSLTINTLEPLGSENGYLRANAYLITSRAGVLKGLHIVSIVPA